MLTFIYWIYATFDRYDIIYDGKRDVYQQFSRPDFYLHHNIPEMKETCR